MRRAIHPHAEGKPALVRTFRTVEELRQALIEFRRTYNESWLIERHRHRSPAQFRRDQMDKLPLAA